MSYWSSSIEIRVTNKKYWDIIKKADIPLSMGGRYFLGQTETWFSGEDDLIEAWYVDDIFYSLIDLLEDKAFIIAEREHSSTGDCDTWIYLGESTKKKTPMIYHIKGNLPDLEDDYADGTIELKDVLKRWDIPIEEANPEILRLIGVYIANYVPEDRHAPVQYEKYLSTAGDLKGFSINGKRIAPTGDFYYDREEIEDFIKSEGGIIARNISGNTALVIIGLENNYAEHSKKLQYAIEYKQKGKPVMIVSDIEFQKWRNSQNPAETTPTEDKEISLDDKLLNTVFFGKYPQNSSDLKDRQPIEWIVLDDKKDKELLISRYILDYRVYNDSSMNNLPIWEDSTIREWLNTEFINEVFSKKEREKIVSVKHGSNSAHGMRWCGTTEDAVFLLSLKELKQYFDEAEDDILAEGTPFAFSKGLRSAVYLFADAADFPEADVTGCWMLRTGGSDGYIYVDAMGFIEDGEEPVLPCGIRPALWRLK